ncbi:MAG: hypothetical protein WCP20_11040 [Desulfuromonadales bacterium]
MARTLLPVMAQSKSAASVPARSLSCPAAVYPLKSNAAPVESVTVNSRWKVAPCSMI